MSLDRSLRSNWRPTSPSGYFSCSTLRQSILEQEACSSSRLLSKGRLDLAFFKRRCRFKLCAQASKDESVTARIAFQLLFATRGRTQARASRCRTCPHSTRRVSPQHVQERRASCRHQSGMTAAEELETNRLLPVTLPLLAAVALKRSSTAEAW